MLQQDFHRDSNPAYDKVAFVADHYEELVSMYKDILEKLKADRYDELEYMYQDILEKLKADRYDELEYMYQDILEKLKASSSGDLFETREVTFIPYYVAINKDFFEDDTPIPKYVNLTPKQMFGGTPEEIAKRLKCSSNPEYSQRVFSNAVYINTVSRTSTFYRYNPAKRSNDAFTETKEYYVFAIDSPVQHESAVDCYLSSNLYKYYEGKNISEQLFNLYFDGYSDSSESSNMYFFILRKNPDKSSYDFIKWDCADKCRKYEDFTFTEIIPKGNAVMTFLGLDQ